LFVFINLWIFSCQGKRQKRAGNLRELLPNGTPQQVDAAVKQAIEDAADGGGLIICSSNSLHPGVNPDNCIAMFNTRYCFLPASPQLPLSRQRLR